MTGQDTQGVVTDGTSRPHEDHGDGLVRNGIVTRGEEITSGGEKAQGPLFHIEIAAAEPEQTMTVSMGNTPPS